MNMVMQQYSGSRLKTVETQIFIFLNFNQLHSLGSCSKEDTAVHDSKLHSVYIVMCWRVCFYLQHDSVPLLLWMSPHGFPKDCTS